MSAADSLHCQAQLADVTARGGVGNTGLIWKGIQEWSMEVQVSNPAACKPKGCHLYSGLSQAFACLSW